MLRSGVQGQAGKAYPKSINISIFRRVEESWYVEAFEFILLISGGKDRNSFENTKAQSQKPENGLKNYADHFNNIASFNKLRF